jgi:hypothetical protein
MSLDTSFNDFASEETLARRYGLTHTTFATGISGAGDNIVYTPTANKNVRLLWIGLASPESNTAEVLTKVKIGNETKYQWPLSVPGAFAHYEPINGTGNASLIVNLSAAQVVHVNVTLEEF